MDWDGDGTFDEFGVSGTVTHDYGVAGTYQIRIRGTYDSIIFDNAGDKEKILSLDQWGANSWTSMYAAFTGAANLTVPATDNPDFSAVTDMRFMFAEASVANPNTSGWDTSAVTNFHAMFRNAASANPDTSSWNTSAVTDMSFMFFQASLASPETSDWNTSAVTDMSSMFFQAQSANPDVSGWDTSAVISMSYTFAWIPINPDTRGWDTSAVETMGAMFAGTSFNRDIGSWDVTALTDASGMFTFVTLSTSNYESLLVGWDDQVLQSGVPFSGGDSTYCSAAATAARANMIASDSWVITDGGQYCSSVPDNPLTAPDLTPETDTGVSDSDNFTTINTPDFYVDCSAASNTITLYTDNPVADTAIGSYICISDGIEIASVSAPLPAGIHNVSYTDKDDNGESGHSPHLAVTIDLIFAGGFE